MLAHGDMRACRVSGRQRRQSKSNYAAALALGIFALVAQGCSGDPRVPMRGPDPADPNASVPPATYRSTVGPYTSARPVAPAPWREQNERVAPQPKS